VVVVVVVEVVMVKKGWALTMDPTV